MVCRAEFRGGISNLKRSILSSHVSQTGKPQIEFRYEISDRNSAVKFRYGILIEIIKQNLDIKF